MKKIIDFTRKQSFPYILLFVLCALQFVYVYNKNFNELPDNFGLVVSIILGVLVIQIIRNNKIFHVLITLLVTILIGYLILAFLSDLVKTDGIDFGFFRFLILGILFFALMIFIDIQLFKGKPERLF